MQYYIDSLDNDTIFADIIKSVSMQFRFDAIQVPEIDVRQYAHLTLSVTE